MLKQQLEFFLEEEGYAKIPSNLPEFTIYYQMENNYVNVFHVIDYRQNIYISEDQYLHIKEKIKDLFKEKGIHNIHVLSLIISADIQRAKQLYADDAMCWILEPFEQRLVIFENQVSDFYGMKEKMEYFLSHIEQEQIPSAPLKERKKLSYVTISLVFINIIIFLLCTFTEEVLYNIGAFNAAAFIEQREYYRIFTSMFLHWDINHLVSNMIVLYYLGEVVEKYFGAVRYSVIYLAAGICGNLLSMIYEIYTGVQIESVGASGAIFGIIGALLILVLVHKGHLEQITTGRLLFMISYSLYSGFVGSNINNAAHIGGLASGIILAFIFWILKKPKTNTMQ